MKKAARIGPTPPAAMYAVLLLAALCTLACGYHPSCVLVDTTTTNDGGSKGQCSVLGDKVLLRCCSVEKLVNGSAGEKSFSQCGVQKAFDGRGELLSREEVVLDGVKGLLCFSMQYTELEVWLSCHHDNQLKCVAIRSDESDQDVKHLAKRSSGGIAYKVLDNSQEGANLEPVHGSGLVALVVSIATVGLLVLLVMLCASGSSKKHTFETANDNDVEAGTITEHKQDGGVSVPSPEVRTLQEVDAEVQEVHLQMPENPGEAPSREVQGNSPPVEDQGWAEPQGGGGGDEQRPEGVEADPVVVVEDGGRDLEDEDDPRYEAVRHPQQQVQLPAEPVEVINRPASPEGEAEADTPQRDGVKISYAVVSRHPGQPSYASVGEVLPADEAAPVVEDDPQQDIGRYEEVELEQGQHKDGYAEVRIGSLGVEATGDSTETSSQRDSMYDTVGYDSVNHPPAAASSQDSTKDDMYETVPDSVRQLSPTRAKDVAPELPPMRVRGISSSEDDPRVQSLEGSGKEGKKEGKGSKDSKPSKEKGKGFGIFTRSRASTVNTTLKTSKGKEGSKEREVPEGPPLPPNHPPAGITRTSTSSAPRSSTSSVPPCLPPPPPPEDEECYSEPFDRGPATGPPRKMSNSARPYAEPSQKMRSARLQSNPILSPRGGALPDIPSASELDPEYESVSPETQRAAMNRAMAVAAEEDEEGEIPYDTVARIPGTSLPVSVSKLGDAAKQPQSDEEEEESPYDVVARVPGSSIVVSVGATGVAMETGEDGDEEEEETPYDTVKKIPGTSVAVSVGAVEGATGGQTEDGTEETEDHPYSKVDKTKVHAYATVDKSKKQSDEDDSQTRHMTLPSDAALEHDEMGYAVVSEEFKRARTMSRDPQAMRALVKKKAPETETSDYSVVADDLRKMVLTGAVNGGEGVVSSPELPSTPSPPPPISPIKDQDIILDFVAPETPPHPVMDLEEGCKSSEPPLSRQLMLSAGDASSLEAEQTGLVMDSENPYDTVDEDLKGFRESPQL